MGNNLFFQTILKAFAGKPFRVVVSTSDRFGKDDFPDLPHNIMVFPWVPGKLLISRADLVIFHGGYGTMMECVAYGKPSIVIPFQTEQEGNGRRLEQLGCGALLRLSEERGQRVIRDMVLRQIHIHGPEKIRSDTGKLCTGKWRQYLATPDTGITSEHSSRKWQSIRV